MESEAQYRVKIQAVYDRIQNAMDAVDPDVAEVEQSMGALTIRFADGSRCILSAQPSVRQLWLALAKEGVAYHFELSSQPQGGSDPQKAPDAQMGPDIWVDDRGKGIELVSFLQKYLRDASGLSISL